MKLDIATESDSEALSKFYKQFISSGLVEYKIDRRNDFFNPYKSQSDNYRTYVLRDEDGIHGLASFIFKETLLNGERKKIAYATDLRVSNNRKAILEWAHHFVPVLRDVMNKDAEHVFSAINMHEISAINTFIRPRSMRRPMPRYYLYRKFELVTIHGKFPWAAKPIPSITFREANLGNVDALANYIARRSGYRPFSTQWDRESFETKFARLYGMRLSDITIAYDHHDNIIGCVGLYPGQNTHDIIPYSYSLVGHNFRQFLKFLWVFGMTRRLSKPVASTGKESPFHFKHMVFLHADNETVFEGLVWHAYENASSNEFLMYAHCENDFRLNPPEHWITARLPFALYNVTLPEHPKPPFLDPQISFNPELESVFLI